ncbi:YrhB domain-containing protein [Streptomyces lydicamycinicus]|uniref:YrhB domain-containing protein n=1 Tax=Streptomyces lydicamycinicus TaxID=1546107 RepID=UPI0032E04DED
MERDAAVRLVEEELERDYQRELSAGLDPMRMAVAHVREHELAWIVSWTSEEYLRTGNSRFMLAGNGPYLVDRVDGACTGSASSPRSPGPGRWTTGSASEVRPHGPRWTSCTRKCGPWRPPGHHSETGR